MTEKLYFALLKDLGMIAGIGGIALGVFVLLFREVILLKIFTTLSKRQSYTIIILFMIFVWSISIYCLINYFKKDSNSVNVFVHGESGANEFVLLNRGKVTMSFGKAIKEETINSKGVATFDEIPSKFFKNYKKVKITFSDPNGEPYRVLHPDSLYQLDEGEIINLIVKLDGLDRLSGTVTDFNTGNFIKNARVSIAQDFTFSNEFGEFTLNISKKNQKQLQTVRAYIDNYKPYVQYDTPMQTPEGMEIKLKH
jgi:hypothetical protein